MRCAKCGTLVEGSNGTCPLCGAPLATQVPVYPPRKARVRSYVIPFTLVYWVVALEATLVAAAINAAYAWGTHYWAIVFTGLLWIYFLLRRTILGIENWHYKILTNTMLSILLLIVIGFVLHHEEVVMGWVIPIFYLANWVLDGVVALAAINRARRYLLGLWWQGLLAAVIFVLCFSLHVYWWPSVVCGGIGLLLCFIITVSRPREVMSQIKRSVDM